VCPDVPLHARNVSALPGSGKNPALKSRLKPALRKSHVQQAAGSHRIEMFNRVDCKLAVLHTVRKIYLVYR